VWTPAADWAKRAGSEAGIADGTPAAGGIPMAVGCGAGSCCNMIGGALVGDEGVASGIGADGCPFWAQAVDVDAAGTEIARPQKPRTNRDRTRMRELLSPIRNPAQGSSYPGAGRNPLNPCGEWRLGLTILRGQMTQARNHAAGNPAF
jgi:hypothetical protein